MNQSIDTQQYLQRLWPINRSLTGNGNRETLRILGEIVDFEIHETPSGTRCFDWVVPPEWNVKEAWIKDSKGNRIVDFEKNNLHLLGYSEPFRGTLNFDELRKHLYTKPEQPEVIPYLTSYYQRRWGFCLSQNMLDKMNVQDTYEICIDSELNAAGSMTWAEAVIPGTSDREIFFSTYFCHPSMANDVITGMLGQALLYNKIKALKNNHYTYRFLWIPETIGSINYLQLKGEELKSKMLAGFVLTCLGDDAPFMYKRSRDKDSYTNRTVERLLGCEGIDCVIEDFWPGGSDERQYCSPAFDMPVGLIMRTRFEKFPQYHTSADDLDFISINAFEKTIDLYMKVVQEIEKNPVYISNNPHCEPLLGKRRLYPTLGAQEKYPDYIDAMMWVLNLSDGKHDLKSMAERSGMDLNLLQEIANKMESENLIRKI